jgi:TPP-dependent pyruvate/acetoin dehydrogenase alpha subunit
VKAKDPIDRFKAHILAEGVASEEQLAGWTRALIAEVAEAVTVAQGAPGPRRRNSSRTSTHRK